MRALEPEPEVDELFRRLGINWCFLYIFSFELEPQDHALSGLDLHQQLAVHTLGRVGLNHNRSYSIDPPAMRSRRVSMAEFLGPRFDLKQYRLMGPSPTQSLEQWAFDEKENGYAGQGFAYALTDPPYGMAITNELHNELFIQLGMRIFSDYRDVLEIRQWSTDWSNYFDNGHEWWGSFCWTLRDPEGASLMGIVASSTD